MTSVVETMKLYSVLFIVLVVMFGELHRTQMYILQKTNSLISLIGLGLVSGEDTETEDTRPCVITDDDGWCTHHLGDPTPGMDEWDWRQELFL